MNPNLYRIQSSFRSFSDIQHWHHPHAVTLTLRQTRQAESIKGDFKLVLTPAEASENMRIFLNRLNKSVFGNAAARYGKRVSVVPVLEGGYGKRLHYHVAIDCPRDELLPTFPDLIRETWLKTPWGYDQIDIQPDADNGWINYISKFNDKTSYADSIDWANYHAPRSLS